jgi:2-keto-myo-inositol isomerase
MQRRDFLGASMAAVTLTASGAARGGQFDPCLNEASTLEAPFADDCAAYAEAGFKHLELWFDKLRRQNVQPSEVRELLRRHQLTAVSACASEGSLWQGQGPPESSLHEMERNFELAQAIGVPRYVVFSYVQGNVGPDDYHLAAERLQRLAELAARYKVRIALEFIARSALLGSMLTTLGVMREARQDNVGLCLDTFHFFAGISKLEDLDELRPGEVEHVHFHDVPGSIPRELLRDTDRIPPGQGVIPLERVTAALHRISYSGNLSTELFGTKYQKGDPRSIARLCFKALQRYCAA